MMPHFRNPSAFYLVDVRTGTRRLVLGTGPPQAPGSWIGRQLCRRRRLSLECRNTDSARAMVAGSRNWQGPACRREPLLAHGSQRCGVGPILSLRRDRAKSKVVFRLDIASGHVERWYEADLPVADPSPVSMLSPDADGHVLIEIGGDSAPRLGLVVGPDQFRPLDVPVGFPVVSDAYLQNPGVWLSLRGGGLALYTASDGVRIMTRQTDIFDLAGGCA